MNLSLRVLVLATLLAPLSFAQESGSLEDAQKNALKLKAALGTLSDPPLAITADSDKPSLLKAGDESGIMFVPDRKLDAEGLAGAGSAIVPLGQLWMRKITLLVDGKAVTGEKLRTVTVGDDEKEAVLVLFLAGVGQSASGSPELVLYARDKEPLLRVPLESIKGVKGSVPVELSGRKAGDDTGELTVKILGQYQVGLFVTTAK